MFFSECKDMKAVFMTKVHKNNHPPPNRRKYESTQWNVQVTSLMWETAQCLNLGQMLIVSIVKILAYLATFNVSSNDNEFSVTFQ